MIAKKKHQKKVIEPTDWFSSLVYSHKKGKSLIIYLNPELKGPRHKILTMEELSHHFASAKIFSKLNAKADTDKQSWIETLFAKNIPVTRWKFLLPKFPLGLTVSQDIFERKMDQIRRKVMALMMSLSQPNQEGMKTSNTN